MGSSRKPLTTTTRNNKNQNKTEMKEPEPWEALDHELEESLLGFPCNRNNSVSFSPTNNNNNKSFRTTNPFLGTCSLKSRFHSHSNSTPIIPGPAGAVQSAMLRKISMSAGEEPIPTQEYIRRAAEDPGQQDEDFSRDPWLFAVDFIRRQGWVGGDGVAIGTPLSVIKSGISINKVSQIVAILKSSSPNGLGDMMVTLKDPTGTIDASIHRGVFTEGELGKDIAVGAVLLLQKVAVFRPSRSTHCLNLTLSNLVKVISKDSESSLDQDNPVLTTVKHAAPCFESTEKSWMPPKTFSQSQGRNEEILNFLRGSVQDDKQMEKVNASPPSSYCGAEGSRNQNSIVDEALVARKDVNGMKVVVAGTGTRTKGQGILLSEQIIPPNEAVRSNLLNDVQCSNDVANFVVIPNNEENGNINGVKKHGQLRVPTGSLPQWTNEQLDELLSYD